VGVKNGIFAPVYVRYALVGCMRLLLTCW
jgi:hypothetical protein